MDLLTLPGLTPFSDAWDLQRELHAAVADGDRDELLLMVEHESVYTAGRRTRRDERPDGPVHGPDGHAVVVDVDRGGKVTWHGPGQLVAYPIVRLDAPIDVVAYVRALERSVMDVCANLGVTTVRVNGRSGVWLPATGSQRERKVCAIGVRVARGVTMHGLALNCQPDLRWFDPIVPCGIDDADVTSLTAELGRTVSPSEAAPLLAASLDATLTALRRPYTARHLQPTGGPRDHRP